MPYFAPYQRFLGVDGGAARATTAPKAPELAAAVLTLGELA